MITATLWGGPRDGEQVTVAPPYGPVPGVLVFPVQVAVPDISVTDLHATFTEVRYRLRPKARCCATWCVWPALCSCCPRCDQAPVIYDLERS